MEYDISRISSLHMNLSGFARAMDLLITLPQTGSYEDLKSREPRTLSTYAHEWTHYFQFLGTNLGHLLMDLNQTKYEMQMKYLIAIKRNQDWNESIPSFFIPLKDDTKEEFSAVYIKESIRDNLYIINEQFTCFSLKGYYPVNFTGIPKIKISIDEYRYHNEIKIGEWTGSVTAIQMMEHAAVSSQYIPNGFEYNSFFNPMLADYYFGYWYLIQQDIIGICPGKTKDYVKISRFLDQQDPDIVPLIMFLFTQIASNLCEFVQISVEDTEPWRQRIDPYNSSIVARAKANHAAYLFCQLLKEFKTLAEIVIKTLDSGESWLDAANNVCKKIGFVDYISSIQLGLKRLERYFIKWGNLKDDILENIPEDKDYFNFTAYTTKKYMYDFLSSSMIEPELHYYPFYKHDDLPIPRVITFKKDRERRFISFSLGQLSDRIEAFKIPKDLIAYSIEQNRILDAICFENRIPCYPQITDDEIAQGLSVYTCEQFEKCRIRWKTGELNFCDNENWKMLTKAILEGIGKNYENFSSK